MDAPQQVIFSSVHVLNNKWSLLGEIGWQDWSTLSQSEVTVGGIALTVARVTGIALIALGVACWPGTPLVGILTYSATVTLYLVYVGFAGDSTGILLWPAVILHVILTVLLIRALFQSGQQQRIPS